MIVVDASVMIRFLLDGSQEERQRCGGALASDPILAAPPVFGLEVLGRISGLMKATGPHRLSQPDALHLIALWRAVDVQILDFDPIGNVETLLRLGANLSIPDASYLALTLAHQDAQLVTLDERLLKGAQHLGYGDRVFTP